MRTPWTARSTGCECVLHLAALIGIPYSYTAPRSYVSTNVTGTLNVLEAVRRHSVARMVHTSTSEVYGSARYEPIDEEHPIQAQSPYSATKVAADKLAESYARSFELPVATLRPFNTYGPRQSARAVIPTILAQLVRGRETVELGSLDPQRDLNYVDDTVAGFLAIAECDAAVGETVNVGSGRSIRVGDLARMLAAMVNPSAEIVATQERLRPANSEVALLRCDHAKAERLMGWRPRVSLKEGLARTLDFVRDNLELYDTEEYVQ